MFIIASAQFALFYPGVPDTPVDFILSQEIIDADGIAETVEAWVSYLAPFSRSEWAEYTAGPGATPGDAYTPQQWEQWWDEETAARPERGYVLNWALAWLDLPGLVATYRNAVHVVMANNRRLPNNSGGAARSPRISHWGAKE